MLYTGRLKVTIVTPNDYDHSTEMDVSQYDQSVIEQLADQLEETRKEGEPFLELKAVEDEDFETD
jgi:hypothetical protein